MSKWLEKALKDIGVHSDTMTLSEMSEDIERKTYIAICDSFECTRKYLARKVRKNVKHGVIVCPDCKCALFWKEDRG